MTLFIMSRRHSNRLNSILSRFVGILDFLLTILNYTNLIFVRTSIFILVVGVSVRFECCVSRV